MAKIYRIVLEKSAEGISSIVITNDLAEKWGVGVECIDNLAEMNTPILFPEVIRSMTDIITDLLVTDGKKSDYSTSMYSDLNEQIEDVMYSVSNDDNGDEMYVFNNEKGINGASVLLYPELVKGFAQKKRSDLYILPSSVHECIVLAFNK